jgi:hypothetical protein
MIVTFVTSLVALAAVAGTAAAANNVAVAVGVDSAKITSNGGAGGDCTWLVKTTVTVVNLTSSSVTVADENGPGGRVVWGYTGNSGVVTPDVTMMWPNGGVVPGNSTLEGTADAIFTIPCDSTSGDLGLDFHITDQNNQETTLSGDAPFLQDGTPLPLYAGLAGLLFVLLLGGALLMRQRRHAKAATH